jgi:hypothetical protein
VLDPPAIKFTSAARALDAAAATRSIANSNPITIKFFKKEACDNPTPKGYSCSFDWQVASAKRLDVQQTYQARSSIRTPAHAHSLRVVPWYDVANSMPRKNSMIEVTRVQTGVRLESSLLKVLKALATYTDLGLGDLLEGICLHAFEGKQPFSPETLEQIDRFRHIYGLSLTAADSHRLTELPSGRAARSAPKKKHKTRR